MTLKKLDIKKLAGKLSLSALAAFALVAVSFTGVAEATNGTGYGNGGNANIDLSIDGIGHTINLIFNFFFG